MALLAGATVTVETKWFPPLVVPLDGGTDAGGVSGAFGGLATKLLKPRVTVSYQGSTLYTATPGGDPGVNEWSTVRWVIAGVLVFVVWKLVF